MIEEPRRGPRPPNPIRRRGRSPLLLGVILVSLAGGLGAGPASGSPLDEFRALSPDSLDARLDLIAADPVAFAAAFDSALALSGWAADPAGWEETAALYHEAVGDSLLIWDLGFLRGAGPGTRADWLEGVRADARGAALRAAGDHSGAAQAYREAAEAYARTGHLRREAVAWGSLGVAFWYAGDFDGVADAYTRALDARERLGDPVLIGRTLNGLGSMNLQTGDYPAALSFYERARRVRETLDDPGDLGTTITYVGHVQYRMGNLEAARAAYRDALAALGPDAPARALINAQVGLANVHSDLGEHAEALDIYRRQLALAEEIEDDQLAATVHHNMGRLLLDLGDMTGSLQELDRARLIHEERGDLFESANVLNSVGSVYLALGNLPRALEAAQEARAKAAEARNVMAEGGALLNLSWIYGRMDLADRGLESAEEALALFSEVDNPELAANCYNTMASLRGDQGDPAAALELYRRAEDLYREGEANANVAAVRGNLGNTLSALGRLAEGRAEYRAGAAVAEEYGLAPALWPIYLGLADNYELDGMLDSARVYNDRAITVMESLRGAALSEETKSAFLGERAFVYDAQVNLLAKLHDRDPGAGYDREAFRVAERGKARALLDLLTAGQVDLDRGLDAAAVAERKDRERSVNAARYLLREAGDAGVSADSLRTLKRRLRTLESDYAAFLERLRYQNPRFAAADMGEPRSLEEIRRVLLTDDRDLLLEYSLGDSASYLWVVTRKTAELHRLPPRAELEAAVQGLRSGLLSPAASGDAAYLQGAADLYGWLLAPAADAPARARRVTVVPDGALQYVPFDVLLREPVEPPARELDAAARNGFFAGLPYALRGVTVRYAPSATTLALLDEAGRGRAGRAPMDFLAVGDPAFSVREPDPAAADGPRGDGLAPLPDTRLEIEAIAALYPADKRTVLLAEDAREETLAGDDYLARYRVLHFATHGLVDERRPEQSSLALAHPRDESEDGYLRAAEIYGLRLDADLVVLSACETGLGRMVRGEGVLGLPRAFFFAGAPSVVVSLWSVSDRSTADLMTAFYREMVRGGAPPAEALTRAKEALREGGQFSHPFHWAPFVLLGPG